MVIIQLSAPNKANKAAVEVQKEIRNENLLPKKFLDRNQIHE